jgi:excisionase family DNA binding protein
MSQVVPNTAESLWDARDAATYLKVSRSWVYAHADIGTLPSVRIGGLRRFIPEQIRAFALGTPVPAAPVLAFPSTKR